VDQLSTPLEIKDQHLVGGGAFLAGLELHLFAAVVFDQALEASAQQEEEHFHPGVPLAKIEDAHLQAVFAGLLHGPFQEKDFTTETQRAQRKKRL